MNNEKSLNPSQYLDSISPDSPGQGVGGPTPLPNPQENKPKPALLIAGIVVAIGLAIVVVVLGIIRMTNRNNAQETPVATPTDNADNTPVGYEPLPKLENGYEALGFFSDDVIIAKRTADGQTVFLDNAYNIVGSVDQDKYAIADYAFHDGLLPILCVDGNNNPEDNKYGYIDVHGNLILACNYDDAQPFADGKAEVIMREPVLDENGQKTDRVIITREIIDTIGTVINSNSEEISPDTGIPAQV